MKVYVRDIQQVEINLEALADGLATESIQTQREFLSLYFGAIETYTYSEKHLKATFQTLLSEMGGNFKKALKAGLE